MVLSMPESKKMSPSLARWLKPNMLAIPVGSKYAVPNPGTLPTMLSRLEPAFVDIVMGLVAGRMSVRKSGFMMVADIVDPVSRMILPASEVHLLCCLRTSPCAGSSSDLTCTAAHPSSSSVSSASWLLRRLRALEERLLRFRLLPVPLLSCSVSVSGSDCSSSGSVPPWARTGFLGLNHLSGAMDAILGQPVL